MQYEQINTVGLILAGGEGRRLGGKDKGLQIYQNKRLVEHVIARLKPQVDDLVICANRNIGEYQKLGFTVVQDSEKTFQGPMAGICAALNHLHGSKFDNAVVASCDVPKLPTDLVKTLSSSSGKLVAVAHDGERKQNLHCLIKKQAWNSVIKAYQSGERAMHRWYAQVGADEVDFSNQAECFLNINSAELLSK